MKLTSLTVVLVIEKAAHCDTTDASGFYKDPMEFQRLLEAQNASNESEAAWMEIYGVAYRPAN